MLFMTVNFSHAESFNCSNFLDQKDCFQIDKLFEEIKNSENFSTLQKNYIKNKTEELSYNINKNKNHNLNKKEYDKLFRYVENILKKNENENIDIINNINKTKELTWKLINNYSKSEYYQNNYRPNNFYQ